MEKKTLGNNLRSLTGLILLLITSKLNAQHVFDVVVYGGTAGGITSAIQIAKMGKTVAIVEPGSHIGGMSVEGLGGSDIDNHKEFQNSPAVGGLSLEFYKRIARAYGREAVFGNALKNRIKAPELWRFESHVAEKVFNEWVSEYKIKVFLNHRLVENSKAVIKEGTRIAEIKTENGASFKAKIFIDATVEGDLLAGAGVSTVVGRESNHQYGETLNGIRAETDHAQFSVKVDPYKMPGDPESGLIPTIQDEPLGIPGEGDKRLQAFCFRVCLTKNPDNQIPFYLPENYRREEYEIYLRYIKAGGKLYRPGAGLPGDKTDLGAWHDLSHNLYGMNMDYPEGSYAVREKILDQHKTFTQGLFYFLSNDPEVGQLDAGLQQEWKSWGYARDEFTDNRGFPRMFYVRDARRMVSDYVITEHHVRKQNPTPVEDPVAMAFWPTDVHSVRRIVKDGYAYNEGFVFGGDYWRPLPVSYRSLVPKASECTNLLTPTCPSSSHIAYGAIRLEWTFMALGEACGAAAAAAIRQKTTVQQLHYSTLKKILIGNRAVISL
jgi:hypothetical protein